MSGQVILHECGWRGYLDNISFFEKKIGLKFNEPEGSEVNGEIFSARLISLLMIGHFTFG